LKLPSETGEINVASFQGTKKVTVQPPRAEQTASNQLPAEVQIPLIEPLLPWKLSAAQEVLDKQYRLYSWNDAKSTSLITANSVLLAAIGFLFPSVQTSIFPLVLLIFAMGLVSASLIFTLLQVVPQGSSGKSGTTKNIRSMRGILSFSSWEDYHKAARDQTEEAFYEDCNRQIFGMTINNDASRRKTTWGVRVTILAVVMLMISVTILTYGKTSSLIESYRDVSKGSPSQIIEPTDAAPKIEDAGQPPNLELGNDSTQIEGASE
jgi:hypothetical protein